MPNVLVVDDDRTIAHIIGSTLDSREIKLLAASGAREARALLREHPVDVAILDVVLPDASGLDVFREIREIDAKIPVIFVTVVGGSDTAIEAIKLGAFDYLLKPLDLEQLETVVNHALEIRRLTHVPVSLDPDSAGAVNSDLMIGSDPMMLSVYKTIGRVASEDIPVLILGESGTGKELVARAIYQHGKRADGPFLALNCAAIPEALLESELFGHEKGAFTGAVALRIGKFEQCSGGTIFLDEIGDMPPLLQAKILRVLQEGTFERVGGNKTIHTDVRIVAATHRDLETKVERGEFRSDLYYRLNGVTIHLPPLRERKEDIVTLAQHFLVKYRAEFDKDIQVVSPEALALMQEYSWPGNIRELQSAMRLAVVQATGSVLVPEFFPKEMTSEPGRDSSAAAIPDVPAAPKGSETADIHCFIVGRLEAGSTNLYAEALAVLEAHLLTLVLKHTEGNQSKAAKILGITRGNLRNKIRAHGISIEQGIKVEGATPGADG
jgi:two-component system nitrogen regulation response regulator GlnG